MHISSVYFPELAVDVQFKVLDGEEIKLFLSPTDVRTSPPSPEFKFKVIENLVFNLHTNVRDSLCMMSPRSAEACLAALYQGCVMLNPDLDPVTWVQLSGSQNTKEKKSDPDDFFDMDLDPPSFIETEVDFSNLPELTSGRKTKGLTKTKVRSIRPYLNANLIGQEEAVSALYNALLVAQAGLKEKKAPVGVFLFAGASGVGKTLAAKLVQKHLFGDVPLIRIDCGEFQHKHENQKLLGAPPGYIGHDDGSPIFNRVNSNPDTVILLDEVEKAHPDFWNTFLHIFDEGYATDNQGMEVEFNRCIIIMTTNLGNDKTVDAQTARAVGFAKETDKSQLPARAFVERNTHDALKDFFKPEFLNRIHETIVFNHLGQEDLLKIANLEMQKLQDLVAEHGIELAWSEEALADLVKRSQNSVKGARDITSTRVKHVDKVIAKMIVDNKVKRGSVVQVGPGLEIRT